MTKRSRIAKNATYLTIASVLQKAITFGYYGYLADSIGSGNLGKYTFALTVGSVFVIFMDFGLGTLLTREVAKDHSSLQKTFNRFFSVKILTMILSFFALVITIHTSAFFFESIDGLDVQLMYIAGIIILLDTLTFTAFSMLRALQKLKWEAIAIIVYQSIIVVLGSLAIYYGQPLTVILSALLAGSAAQLVFMAVTVRRSTGLHFRFTIQKNDVVRLLKYAWPFAIAGIVFKLNGSVDSIMLKIGVSDEAAGVYGLAFKLTFALMVLPGAFATSYYPAMSEYFKESREKMGPLFSRALQYMFLLSFPITAGTLVLGDTFVLRIWEDFGESVAPLMVFMVALPFLFANYPIGNLLNAANLQRRNTTQMLVALVVNIVLNVLLIPPYGVVGAAIAQLVSSVVLIALGFPLAYRVAPFPLTPLLRRTLALAAAAVVMALVVWLLEDRVHLLICIVAGVLVYPVAVLAFGGVQLSELKRMGASVTRRS